MIRAGLPPDRHRECFPSLDALKAITDDTGIFQHGLGGIPDPQHGYTTDDNCRALLVAVRLWRRWPERRAEIEPLLMRYAAFLRWTQVREGPAAGRFVNFVGYDRRYLDADGTPDCLGRCLWALAEAASGPLPPTVDIAIDTLLADARDARDFLLASPRACAYALLGLARDPNFDPKILRALSAPLITGWETYSTKDWPWFEPYLTYDNARLVEACRRTADALSDDRLSRIADKSLAFLTRSSFRGDVLHPVGNRGWWPQGGECALYDQQPLEAAAYTELYRLVGDTEREKRSMEWFLGRNSLGISLVDPASGFCHDGLQPEGANRNGGAESVVAWLLAVT